MPPSPPGPRTPQGKFPSAGPETGLFTTCLNQALDLSGAGILEITRAQNRRYRRSVEEFHRRNPLRPEPIKSR